MIDFFSDFFIMAGIYVILALSANLLIGMTNLMTLCLASFYGIGAYLGSFFLLHHDLPFIVIALIVMVATGLSALLVALASIRLKGDSYVLATLGFQFVFISVLFNWGNVTNGDKGVHGIPRIELGGILPLKNDLAYLALVVLVALLAIWMFSRLQRSPFGRGLRAIRYDELSAKALGRNTAGLKCWAVFLSAAFCGLAGLLYASFKESLHPNRFSLDICILILTSLFIGGAGNRVSGPVLGALIVAFLSVALDILDNVGFDGIANLEQVLFGLALLALLFLRPQGMVGNTRI
jgi:branched-chain amino acid transport system permease protein